MTCVCGIDPGKSGAIAFFFNGHPQHVSVYDMPIVDGLVCGAQLTQQVEQLKPDVVFIEQVSSRPGEGVSSAFGFGRSFGIVIGVVQALKIPHTLVTPRKWKRHFGLDADKEKSRALALRTFTGSTVHFTRKKDEGRAEAALLALYGAQQSTGLAQAGGATGEASASPSFPHGTRIAAE